MMPCCTIGYPSASITNYNQKLKVRLTCFFVVFFFFLLNVTFDLTVSTLKLIRPGFTGHLIF
jgi:hypothetical protein